MKTTMHLSPKQVTGNVWLEEGLRAELTKRLDPHLQFYYHISSHQRFYEGELPDFSKPASKPRKDHITRRELLTSNIGGRVTLAQHGASSIRTQYHNVLPPSPDMPTPNRPFVLNVVRPVTCMQGILPRNMTL